MERCNEAAHDDHSPHLLGALEDVTNLQFSQIGNNWVAAINVVDGVTKKGKSVDTSSFTNQEILTCDRFPLYDQYSDTNNQDDMIKDQLSKLKAQQTSSTSPMFALSLTVTQNSFPWLEPIVKNGEAANRAFPELLWLASPSRFILISSLLTHT